MFGLYLWNRTWTRTQAWTLSLWIVAVFHARLWVALAQHLVSSDPFASMRMPLTFQLRFSFRLLLLLLRLLPLLLACASLFVFQQLSARFQCQRHWWHWSQLELLALGFFFFFWHFFVFHFVHISIFCRVWRVFCFFNKIQPEFTHKIYVKIFLSVLVYLHTQRVTANGRCLICLLFLVFKLILYTFGCFQVQSN